jgi:hypothetical protein
MDGDVFVELAFTGKGEWNFATGKEVVYGWWVGI